MLVCDGAWGGMSLLSGSEGVVALDDCCCPCGLTSNLLSMTYVQVSALSGSHTLGDEGSSM